LTTLVIDTPRWAKPLLGPRRFKGAKGGRGSGKSHFFADALIEEHIINPDLKSVCIREIQKSLTFSAKMLLESKIRSLGVSHMFRVTDNLIRRVGGHGLIIFQGMQDHTADSIKSLEGFGRAWCEEAQNLSERSMELLLPTIREPGSELWFSWNPENETDPVERLFSVPGDDMACVHVNFTDNPFLPDELRSLEKMHRERWPDTYDHVWLGDFNKISEAQIFKGRWRVDEFDTPANVRFFHGADWGFSQDPTVLMRAFVQDDCLYVDQEAYGVGVELDETAQLFDSIPTARRWPIKADSARPETISHMRRKGFNIAPAQKWSGSVADGLAVLKSFREIVIHARCKHMAQEARLYSYKIDKQNGDILPIIVDAHNHCWDALRYALDGYIKGQGPLKISPNALAHAARR